VNVDSGRRHEVPAASCPDAAIDDQFGAIPQRLDEAGGGIGALLFGVIERRGRALSSVTS